MSFDDEWKTGDKYFKTWHEYTVCVFCAGLTPATSGEKQKRIWKFEATFGKDTHLGLFDESSDARNACLEHRNKNNK